MTLLERTQTLKREIGEYASQKRDASKLDRIREKTIECKVEREKIEGLKETIELMAGAKALPKPFANIESDTPAIQDLAKKLKEHLQKDPVEASGETWAKFFTKSETASGDLRSALISAWPVHVDNRIPNIGTYIPFKEISKYRKTVEEMEEIVEKTVRWKGQLPGKKGEIDRLEEARKKILELIDSLDMKNVPEDVLAFLRDCAGGNARLSDLTPKILKWLEENRFTENLKVSTTS